MVEEITINKIEWSAPEYIHKDRDTDWFWAMGLATLVVFLIAIWIKNYLFGIFIIISGCCLALFNIRHPEEINFSIENNGITMGRDKYDWKSIKSFNIKKDSDNSKLLIQTNKYFLPIYTIPVPNNLIDEIKESVLKFVPNVELEESKSMQFMEKLGF
jgi:hypothetical protein